MRRKNEIEEQDVDEANPHPGRKFLDQFKPRKITVISGPDGLPVEKDPPWRHQDAIPPPLAPMTMACLAQPRDARIGRLVDIPKCRYYRRQRTTATEIPGATTIDRYCMHPAMRGLNGAAMAVGDCAIFNCELRDPVDPATEPILDSIDNEKISLGEKRLETEGYLAAEEDRRTVGYRMFRTEEDVKEGRTTVDEEDYSEISD